MRVVFAGMRVAGSTRDWSTQVRYYTNTGPLYAAWATLLTLRYLCHAAQVTLPAPRYSGHATCATLLMPRYPLYQRVSTITIPATICLSVDEGREAESKC